MTLLFDPTVSTQLCRSLVILGCICVVDWLESDCGAGACREHLVDPT